MQRLPRCATLLRASKPLVSPPIIQYGLRRHFIHQVPGVQRIMRMHMKEDFRRVSTLVFLPPLMALSGLAVLSIAGFVGLQIWIENVGMATGGASEPTPWGWELDLEDWSGGVKGGTDPSLGILPRMALRSAWMFQRWGAHAAPAVLSDSTNEANEGAASQSAQNRGYQLAEENIIWAMKLLRGRQKEIPRAIIQRHAELLETIGTTDALTKAFLDWKYLYDTVSPDSLEASKLALRLADLAGRFGQDDSMLDFLNAALKVGNVGVDSANPTSSTLTPPGQRHLASAYLSLSSFFSSRQQLQIAWGTQQEASKFLALYLPTPPISASVPEESLHLLYLVHRASVLSIHQAEVQYAQKKHMKSCIGHLDAAAKSAEAVARTLCDGPGNHTQVTKGVSPQPKQLGPPLPDHMLLDVYQESKTLLKPAVSLLRDAWRTAMRAHMLKGMLLEREDDSTALESYQKALFWAGTTVERGKLFGIPSEEIISIQHKIAQLEANSKR